MFLAITVGLSILSGYTSTLSPEYLFLNPIEDAYIYNWAQEEVLQEETLTYLISTEIPCHSGSLCMYATAELCLQLQYNKESWYYDNAYCYYDNETCIAL